MAANTLREGGLAGPAHQLSTAAVAAFLHSLRGSLHLAGGVALGGAVMAAALLPSRPGVSLDDLPEDEVELDEPMLAFEP